MRVPFVGKLVSTGRGEVDLLDYNYGVKVRRDCHQGNFSSGLGPAGIRSVKLDIP